MRNNASGIWEYALIMSRYTETCHLWRFCFDDLDDLQAFVGRARQAPAPAPPIFHLQMNLYPPARLYSGMHLSTLNESSAASRGDNRALRKTQRHWEENIERLGKTCEELSTLRTLLITILPSPTYCYLENEASVVKSVEAITSVPKLMVESLGLAQFRRGSSVTGNALKE